MFGDVIPAVTKAAKVKARVLSNCLPNAAALPGLWETALHTAMAAACASSGARPSARESA